MAGVEVAFGLPGEENLELIAALDASPIELVVCRHEQHAAFMAVAHARLTGRIGVCVATLGPGALNLFTGLAQAQLIGVPVLALTGQKRLRDNTEGSFQVVEVVASARAIVDHAVSVRDPRRAAPMVSEAITRAVDGGGVSLVELPEDVADMPVSQPVQPARTAYAPVAPDAAIDALVEAVGHANRPLIIAGRGCTDESAADALASCCDRTGLSVIATQMGKGSIPESHARSLRSLGMHRPDYVHAAIDAADLVVCIGYKPVEHPPLAWHRCDQPLVHVHRHPARRELGYEPVVEVVGALDATLDRVRGLRVDTDWTDRYRRAVVRSLDLELDPAEPSNSVAQLPGILEKALTPDHVVALDNGLYKLWFARRYPAEHPAALLLDNALATMGAGLATGMEAARLGHRAVVVTGDGGFAMNAVELETANRLGLDLTVIVLRDDRYGFIAWHQDEEGRDRAAVDLTNPDIVTLAQSFGATGLRVHDGDDVVALLSEPRAGVVVVDYPVDYRCNELLERDDLVEVARRHLADTPGADTPGDDTPGADTPGDDTPGADTPGADTPG